MFTLIVTYAIALFYAYYTSVYIGGVIAYGFNKPIKTGTFPVLESKNLDSKTMVRRLALTGCLAASTSLSIVFYPLVGMLLALYISVYEIKSCWGFYRNNQTLLTNMGMARFTLHTVLTGILITILLT